MTRHKIVRYIEFRHLFELFILTSIVTILGIRIFLSLTGFPTLEVGSIHIAHILWGGFFMLASILGFMTFLNDNLKSFWVILGGIGFGTFIDELGKFVTRNNNYFYQPTFAIIYVIFILLYLFYKGVSNVSRFTTEEYLINSLNMLKEVIIHDLDPHERRLALEYLKKSNSHDRIAQFLMQTFNEIEAQTERNTSMYIKLRQKITGVYTYFISRPWFLDMVAAFFVIRSVSYIISGYMAIVHSSSIFFSGEALELLTRRGILDILRLIGLVLQSYFTIIGTVVIYASRHRAYIHYRNAIFVSIFILQVFSFYRNPLLALFSTIVDLLLLSTLEVMIQQESDRED